MKMFEQPFMHILIASPYLPWPLIDGGRVAQFRTFEAMRGACTFTLVVPVYSLEEEAYAREFAGKFSNVTVEAVRCFHVPSPLTPRARLRRTAGKLLRTIFPPPKAQTSGQPSQASSKSSPWYPFDPLPPDFLAAVEKHLNQGCDIFQAEFAEMLTLGPLMAGRVPSLFAHIQLHFIYARRFLEANGVSGVNSRYITERMIREESAYLKTFDSVFTLSEVDRQALNSFCPGLEIHVSPCPSPEEPMPVALRLERPLQNFVFLAGEGHQANVDGFRWFMKQVWPAIKGRLPEARVEVIGKWSPAAQASLPNHEDINFLGFIPEMMKTLQNKVMIVPVFVGSGIRTKILAAWGASCPVVTTTVGVEGLPGQTGEHFIIADDAPAFAMACIELSQNVDKLNQFAVNGLALVQKYFSLAAVRKTRLEIYEKLLAARRLTKS